MREESTDATRLRARVETAWTALIALAVVTLGFGPIDNNDIGFHIRLGRVIAAHGGLPPHVDRLSWTADGAPYLDHEWLAQLAFAAADRVSGVAGLVVVQGLLLGATLLGLGSILRGSLFARAATLSFVVCMAGSHFQLRPHLLSWLFVVAWLRLVDREAPVRRAVLLAVWANVHASFALAVAFSCVFELVAFARDRSMRRVGYVLAYVAAPLVNPFGPSIYTFGASIRRFTSFVGEWQPFDPSSPYLYLALLGLYLAGRRILATRRLDWGLAWLVLLGLVLTAMRNGIVAWLYLAPLCAEEIETILGRSGVIRRRILLAGAAVPALYVCATALASDRALRFELDRHALPVEATRFLRRHHLPGPIYNDYNFGGYLLWKGNPDQRVFVDGRLEIYGPSGVLDEYLRISRWAAGAASDVRRRGVRTFVVRGDRAVARALLESPDYGLVYFDSNAAIFVRRDVAPGLRRLERISPTRNRHREQLAESIDEAEYLLRENPHAFGMRQVLAYLLYRDGDYEGAARSMSAFFAERPPGLPESAETRRIVHRLRERGYTVER